MSNRSTAPRRQHGMGARGSRRSRLGTVDVATAPTGGRMLVGVVAYQTDVQLFSCARNQHLPGAGALGPSPQRTSAARPSDQIRTEGNHGWSLFRNHRRPSLSISDDTLVNRRIYRHAGCPVRVTMSTARWALIAAFFGALSAVVSRLRGCAHFAPAVRAAGGAGSRVVPAAGLRRVMTISGTSGASDQASSPDMEIGEDGAVW